MKAIIRVHPGPEAKVSVSDGTEIAYDWSEEKGDHTWTCESDPAFAETIAKSDGRAFGQDIAPPFWLGDFERVMEWLKAMGLNPEVVFLAEFIDDEEETYDENGNVIEKIY